MTEHPLILPPEQFLRQQDKRDHFASRETTSDLWSDIWGRFDAPRDVYGAASRLFPVYLNVNHLEVTGLDSILNPPKRIRVLPASNPTSERSFAVTKEASQVLLRERIRSSIDTQLSAFKQPARADMDVSSVAQYLARLARCHFALHGDMSGWQVNAVCGSGDGGVTDLLAQLASPRLDIGSGRSARSIDLRSPQQIDQERRWIEQILARRKTVGSQIVWTLTHLPVAPSVTRYSHDLYEAIWHRLRSLKDWLPTYLGNIQSVAKRKTRWLARLKRSKSTRGAKQHTATMKLGRCGQQVIGIDEFSRRLERGGTSENAFLFAA